MYKLIKLKCGIKLYIDNILHLQINDKISGFQCWKPDDNKRYYCIEFYTKSSKILCEYVDINVWLGIISLLDEKW